MLAGMYSGGSLDKVLEEAAAKGAISVASPLVSVSTEHTWSEAGPLGLKLLQKGQHKEDKYGVKVSGVTKDYVPQHLVGLNLEAMNGEKVDNITHAEVMAKLGECVHTGSRLQGLRWRIRHQICPALLVLWKHLQPSLLSCKHGKYQRQLCRRATAAGWPR